jgi:integrase
MASITERPKKDGTSTWQIMIRLKDQSPIIKTFSTEAEARQFVQLAEPRIIEAHAKAKTKVAAKEKTPALGDFLAMQVKTLLKEFFASSSATVRHKGHAKSLLTNMDDATIAELRRPWFKAHIAKMRGKQTYRKTQFTWATIQAQLQVLSVACSWKCEQLDIPKPEFVFTTRMFPKGWSVSRDRRLSHQEQRKVIYSLRTSSLRAKYAYRLMVRLALETGARLQELVLADWSEVFIERRLWMIPAPHTKCKKTRAVPLSMAATRAFKALRLLSNPASSRVFHQVGTPHHVSASFHAIFENAGLDDFRFHDLRHEAISRMVLYKRKLSIYEIMTIVGHSSLQMLNRYANLRGDELAHKMD